MNGCIDNGEHDGIGVNSTRIKPDTKLISINCVELYTKANYQDFQRFQPVDIAMPADAEATLPVLIEAVKSAIPNDRKAAIEQARRGAPRRPTPQARERTRQAAALAWDASPISTARLRQEIYGADQGPRLVAGRLRRQRQQLAEAAVADGQALPVARRAPGGYGVGYGAPASVGAALANRDLGRFSVSIQSDGDLMYAPGVLWTAAQHKIPLLTVMHNNRGYHQEVMHVQRLSNRRNRVANLGGDHGPGRHQHRESGHRLRQAGEVDGLVGDGADQGSGRARRRCSRKRSQVVKSGEPALIDVWTQPR